MKEKLIKWSKPLLYACMGWGWWFSGGIASNILIGEYPYPDKQD